MSVWKSDETLHLMFDILHQDSSLRQTANVNLYQVTKFFP